MFNYITVFFAHGFCYVTHLNYAKLINKISLPASIRYRRQVLHAAKVPEDSDVAVATGHSKHDCASVGHRDISWVEDDCLMTSHAGTCDDHGVSSSCCLLASIDSSSTSAWPRVVCLLPSLCTPHPSARTRPSASKVLERFALSVCVLTFDSTIHHDPRHFSDSCAICLVHERTLVIHSVPIEIMIWSHPSLTVLTASCQSRLCCKLGCKCYVCGCIVRDVQFHRGLC